MDAFKTCTLQSYFPSKSFENPSKSSTTTVFGRFSESCTWLEKERLKTENSSRFPFTFRCSQYSPSLDSSEWLTGLALRLQMPPDSRARIYLSTQQASKSRWNETRASPLKFPFGIWRIIYYNSRPTGFSDYIINNSLTLWGKSNLNFRFARDQLVHLEIAANMFACRPEFTGKSLKSGNVFH